MCTGYERCWSNQFTLLFCQEGRGLSKKVARQRVINYARHTEQCWSSETLLSHKSLTVLDGFVVPSEAKAIERNSTA